MIYGQLRTESQIYNSSLDRFLGRQKLPPTWFANGGVDHLAIKTFNSGDYKAYLDSYKQYAERITQTRLDGRYIATIRLLGNYSLTFNLLSVKSANRVTDLELMLARPNEQSELQPRLDHAEIYMKYGLIPVRKVLGNRGLRFEDQSNGSHEWVSVKFEDGAEEVKFSDRRLSEIMEEEIDFGTAQVLYRRENEGLQQTGAG